MSPDERRLKLFNKYNKNWFFVRQRLNKPLPEIFHDAVMCPLCGAFYTRDFLNLSVKNHWTLEDVPPKKLGGKPVILTCKNCNNSSGYNIDVTLKEFLEKKPFMDGEIDSEIFLPKASINYEGGKIVCSATLKIAEQDTLIFKVNIKKGERRHDDFLQLHNKKSYGGNFKFQTPSLKFVQIALLKIAYLTLFRKFGHTFSFNRNYDLIRRQILNPKEDLLASFGVMKTDRTDAPPGIYPYTEHENLKSFIVVFDLVNKKRKVRNVVFIPAPFTNSGKFYNDFKAMENFTFRFGQIFKDEDFLTDPKYVFLWMDAFS